MLLKALFWFILAQCYLFSMNLLTLLRNVEALKGLFSWRKASTTSASYNDWNHSSVHQFLFSTWKMQTIDNAIGFRHWKKYMSIHKVKWFTSPVNGLTGTGQP